MPKRYTDPAVYYVGIDPGAGGGFAIVKEWRVVHTHPMPDGELSLWLYLKSLPLLNTNVEFRFCLEKVGGYIPGSGGNIGSAMFNFGRNYGAVLGMLYALEVEFVNPTPAVWQRAVGVEPRGKKETKEQHKRKLRDRAVELFPDQSITLKVADAVLLAHYLSL